MAGTLDLFAEDQPTYRVQVWQYGNRLSRITGVGPVFSEVEAAEDFLCKYLGATLSFKDRLDSLDKLAHQAYTKQWDLAVVYRVRDLQIVSVADIRGVLGTSSGV